MTVFQGVRVGWFAALLAGLCGCSLAVSFDRSRLDASVPDEMDSGPGVCSEDDHSGCGASELCCGIACEATGETQCEACGTPCDPVASSTCTGRTCMCGDNPACEAPTPFCDDVAGECMQCRTSADCTAGACVDGMCRECDPTDNSGCEGDTPICNASFTCEACSVGGTCPGTLTCDASGACLGCTADSECPTPTTPLCDGPGAAGLCVPCDDPDVACGAATPICLSDGRCTECNPATNEGCTDTTPICEQMSATNVMCRGCEPGASECPVDAPLCLGDGSCAECEDDADCDTGLFCDADNTCQNCGTDADCAGHPDGQVCAGAAGSMTCQSCDTTTCDTGCCAAGTTGICLRFAMQDEASCGTGGAMCMACGTGLACGADGTCAAVCNDGVVGSPEVCDDGPISGRGCSNDCSMVETGYDCPPAGGACLCDAGFHVSVNECLSCPGRPAGDDPGGSDTSCCGDGAVTVSEACDDGNNDVCGRCNSATCDNATAAVRLIVAITIDAPPSEGDTVQIFDGANMARFEFTSDATVSPGNVPVTMGDAAASSSALDAAVMASTLLYDRGLSEPTLTLTNRHVGEVMNPVTLGGPADFETRMSFTVTRPGTGSACGVGVGCRSARDCLSGTCMANVCTAP